MMTDMAIAASLALSRGSLGDQCKRARCPRRRRQAPRCKKRHKQQETQPFKGRVARIGPWDMDHDGSFKASAFKPRSLVK